jgi:hypothetical protein
MSVEEGIKEIVLRRVKHILIYSRKDFFKCRALSCVISLYFTPSLIFLLIKSFFL